MHRPHLFERGRKFVLRFVNRPWYPAMIAFLAALDFFIVVVPTDLFLISAVFGRPRRWLPISLTIALGSTLGAVILAYVLDYDQELIHRAFPSVFASSQWAYAERLIEEYGIYAIFFAAVGPLPIQPFVLVGALSAHLSLEGLAISVAAGRVIKFSLFGWIASHAPRLLEKFHVASHDEILTVAPSQPVDQGKLPKRGSPADSPGMP